jgi:nucleotide-binding universal stress UspA family protein
MATTIDKNDADYAWPCRRVLCPIDYTQTSAAALRRAYAIARANRATLTVLHVCPPHVIALTELPGERAMIEARRRLAAAITEASASEATADDPGVEVRPLVLIGDAVRCILDCALANAADLIVMGAHGRRGLTGLCLGSVASGVVKRASCAVLTIPEAATTASHPLGLDDALQGIRSARLNHTTA